MAGITQIDPYEVKNAAGIIEGLVDDYNERCQELFTKFDELNGCWEGKDKDTYVTQVEGFKEDFLKNTNTLRQYHETMNTIADEWIRAQEEVMQQAKKL